jgi:ribosomal protein S18 acetylase RimI-like enzyme
MAAASVDIAVMTMEHYGAVHELLENSTGVTVRSADSREGTQRYLERNPGLSFVAVLHGRIVGCVMCGHDGRRGYLQHLAVDPSHRRQGIGAVLVRRCLDALKDLGIDKIHLDVLADNLPAQRYWTRYGWKRRDDIVRFSFTTSADSNA